MPLPSIATALTDQNGKISAPWYRYFFDTSLQLAQAISDLATLTATVTAGLPTGFFRVRLGPNDGSANVATAAATIILPYAVEVYDENSWFDNALYRFTPTTAGYYFLCNQVYGDGAAEAYLYINGAPVSYGTFSAGSTSEISTVSWIQHFNGTTDYAEFYGFGTTTVYDDIGTFAFGFRIGT